MYAFCWLPQQFSGFNKTQMLFMTLCASISLCILLKQMWQMSRFNNDFFKRLPSTLASSLFVGFVSLPLFLCWLQPLCLALGYLFIYVLTTAQPFACLGLINWKILRAVFHPKFSCLLRRKLNTYILPQPFVTVLVICILTWIKVFKRISKNLKILPTIL